MKSHSTVSDVVEQLKYVESLINIAVAFGITVMAAHCKPKTGHRRQSCGVGVSRSPEFGMGSCGSWV